MVDDILESARNGRLGVDGLLTSFDVENDSKDVAQTHMGRFSHWKKLVTALLLSGKIKMKREIFT